MPLLPSAPTSISQPCRAVDGDTIRGGVERVRLLAIDAPELPGHCRRGRTCAPGDPWASRMTLAQGLRLGPIRLTRTGQDRYGRTLARVTAGGVDLSCRQLQLGQALAKPRWDWQGIVLERCHQP